MLLNILKQMDREQVKQIVEKQWEQILYFQIKITENGFCNLFDNIIFLHQLN